MGEKLRYIGLRGEVIEEEIITETDAVSHSFDRQLQVCEIQFDTGKLTNRTMIMTGNQSGYDLIDNEILAGLHLCRLAGSGRYPPEVSRLVGYSADGPEPFVLLEPYRGVPVSEVAGKLLTADRRRFQISLLIGLRWLSMAGVAHRNIGPHTVRWDEDSRTVQITDLLHATVFGAPRQIVGTPPWAAPEQRANRTAGEIGERDDIWAVGRLIFYVVTGDEPADRDSIMAEPELAQLLDGVFGPPDERPTSRELLVSRLGIKDPVPGPRQENPVLAKGRADFWSHYNSKNLNASNPATSDEQISAAGAPRSWWRILALSAVGIVGVLFAIVIILHIR